MATDNDYEVGYGRPPKHTQFKPGQSGNPNGRPKGTKNFTTDLHEELAEKLLVTENGQQREITKQRAMIKAVVAKALKGDVRAMGLLIRQLTDLQQAKSAEVDNDAMSQEDQAVLESFRDQLAAELKSLAEEQTS